MWLSLFVGFLLLTRARVSNEICALKELLEWLPIAQFESEQKIWSLEEWRSWLDLLIFTTVAYGILEQLL